MSIAMTDEQRRTFDEDGFIILENFLTAEETRRLSDAADEVVGRIQRQKGMPPETHFQVRNALAQHEAFLDLTDCGPIMEARCAAGLADSHATTSSIARSRASCYRSAAAKAWA